MASETRELFLDTAEALFADRGFCGVSIAAIAGELGLTKQALLHHFGSKEKLYGEVLARISERFEQLGSAATEQGSSPAERLKAFFLRLQQANKNEEAQTRLLMRELLDNQSRASSAGTWYLEPFLRRLITMVQDVPDWKEASETDALTLVYQWLGAINYFAISGPTLSGIFGPKALGEMSSQFPEQLARLIDASLAAR